MKNNNFSLWCDFVEREFLTKEFITLIDEKIINGATSNPSIFKNALLASKAYEEQKKDFAFLKAKELYEILAINDIKFGASLLLKNYVNDEDGFISLEIDPTLPQNKEAYLNEALRLAQSINMPNLMIKIPANEISFEVMSELLSLGYNVNATLVFSPKQTKQCLEAFKKGNENFKKRFPLCSLPKAVISIFVSRFDTLLNEELVKAGFKAFELGIMNATKCYKIIQKEALPNVRALFASTGSKSDKISKDYYIKELQFENSINTAPLEAIKCFVQNKSEMKEEKSDDFIEDYFYKIEKSKINLQEAYEKLLNDGLEQFKLAFSELKQTLEKGK